MHLDRLSMIRMALGSLGLEKVPRLGVLQSAGSSFHIKTVGRGSLVFVLFSLMEFETVGAPIRGTILNVLKKKSKTNFNLKRLEN